MTSRINTIKSRAYNIDLTRGASKVFHLLISEYPQFEWWSGSHNSLLHHYGQFGLNVHTSEVIELGIRSFHELGLGKEVDLVEYFYAALFHDTGKMFDYRQKEAGDFDEWEPAEHRRLIHHIPRSALIWHDVVHEFPEIEEQYHDNVLHAILAHHGQREPGSPVAPKTRVAWMLHLCDGISARMNDCIRVDVLKKPA